MEEDAVFQRVRTAMSEVFSQADASRISRATTAADVADWDSLSHAMLIMRLENDFGCELPLDRASSAQNVGELVDIVRECVA